MTASIIKGYVPGSIGRIAEMHGKYYHRHAGFGCYFEAKVAKELSEFLYHCNEENDGLWLIGNNGQVEGSIAIDGAQGKEDAHLRWFIVSDLLRGNGYGNKLLTAALAFCRARSYRLVYLWTFEGLHAARHLYEKYGFSLAYQHRGAQWGLEVTEQRFELQLKISTI